MKSWSVGRRTCNTWQRSFALCQPLGVLASTPCRAPARLCPRRWQQAHAGPSCTAPLASLHEGWSVSTFCALLPCVAGCPPALLQLKPRVNRAAAPVPATRYRAGRECACYMCFAWMWGRGCHRWQCAPWHKALAGRGAQQARLRPGLSWPLRDPSTNRIVDHSHTNLVLSLPSTPTTPQRTAAGPDTPK